MSYQIFSASNRDELAAALAGDKWVVACLCAGWCGSCRDYAVNFAAWAERRPEHHFVWIDIEDQADLVGDLDVDNFPTLLMQRGSTVAFFGPMEPDTRQAERLLQALSETSPQELEREAGSTAQRRTWQECDLKKRLGSLSDAA
ncbi:thioredoxin [Herbaspirillum lusitanum]|uniref:thioredoxin family protein n=1 Tax=Herbaspirillum lusitanum TaxID=213312 RepID=UPI0022386C62|nr:thioredoxin family protein [Herbaspirillum lusitanum]MCW5298607.1 thioredoxin [Herbaspirillum lusitanum]